MRLALFMTRGMSLGAWEKGGSLEREIALYKALANNGVDVGIISYGGPSDKDYEERFPGITVLCNSKNIPRALYEKLIPSLHGGWLRGCDLIKTNQTNGADVALKAAKSAEKPLIARCGYPWWKNVVRANGAKSFKARFANWVEAKVFPAAARVVVTTQAMADDTVARFPKISDKVTVLPNYVDTALFSPARRAAPSRDLLFVGRLSEEKNLEALLKAVELVGCSISLIGDGPLRHPLETQFAHLGDKVRWEGIVPNQDLPALMNDAKVFALVSHYEGHPKSLLEAMGAGMAVVGADSPGICHVIRDGETGLLCPRDHDSIAVALNELLNDDGRRQSLGDAARQYIQTECSLETMVEKELALYDEVLAAHG